MRLSAHRGDPGYDPNHYAWMVVFNGVPQTSADAMRIFTADEERGEVWHYPRDAEGRFRRHPNGGLVVERLQGQVAIVPRPLEA
jgi:hypothetical protein